MISLDYCLKNNNLYGDAFATDTVCRDKSSGGFYIIFLILA